MSAWQDLVQTMKHWRIILFLAWSDMRARYKRSVLGPLWLTLGTALGVVGLGFIWSELFNIDRSVFVPSLTSGLIMWQFISGLITESSALFGRNAAVVRNFNLPLGIHPAQLLLRHLINLAHNIPVFFGVALILGVSVNANTWWALPALILVSLNLLWFSFLVGMLGARFRDLEYIISTIMPILMFLSPVFYRPGYLHFSKNIIWANPISHLIEIVRYPLLGQSPPLFVIRTNVIILLAGWMVTLWLFNAKRNRIAFWV